MLAALFHAGGGFAGNRFRRSEPEGRFGAGDDEGSGRVFVNDPFQLVGIDRFDVDQSLGERWLL